MQARPYVTCHGNIISLWKRLIIILITFWYLSEIMLFEKFGLLGILYRDKRLPLSLRRAALTTIFTASLSSDNISATKWWLFFDLGSFISHVQIFQHIFQAFWGLPFICTRILICDFLPLSKNGPQLTMFVPAFIFQMIFHFWCSCLFAFFQLWLLLRGRNNLLKGHRASLSK